MPVLRNIGCLATCRAGGGQGELHALEDGALVWEEDEIRWVGPESELPPEWTQAGEDPTPVDAAGRRGERPGRGAAEGAEAGRVLDAGGRLVVPGLVDAHTHLAFGGWRADEFERRIRGESYGELARAGGGIASTVRATRASSREDLLGRSRRFLERMAALGVTTVEAKSGYGLALAEELKQLEVYRRLDEERSSGAALPRVVATFLGAHVVPEEFSGDRRGYVDLLVEEWIPEVAGRSLARFCDVFLEEGAFGRDEARRILRAGQEHGLGAKLHADQLTDGSGAALAAELGAVSADHLECASEDGLQAMAEAGVVAVTLPLATLYLDQAPPPARRMIEAGVRVAVATDFNPGSAPSYHLPLAMTLACSRQRMTPAEVLKGATLYAARAVDEEERVGSLEEGKRADFAVVDAPDPNHWLYHLRPNACVATVAGGSVIRPRTRAPAGSAGGEKEAGRDCADGARTQDGREEAHG